MNVVFDPLHEAVSLLGEAATHLNQAMMGKVSNLSWQDALAMLDEIRQALDQIQAIDASLVRHLYLVAPHGQTEVDGVGVIDVRRSNNRSKWDERSAIFAALDNLMAEREGEIPDPADVVDMVLEVAGIGYLRVGALRARGLRPDDYCHTEPGKPTVSITRPGS